MLHLCFNYASSVLQVPCTFRASIALPISTTLSLSTFLLLAAVKIGILPFF